MERKVVSKQYKIFNSQTSKIVYGRSVKFDESCPFYREMEILKLMKMEKVLAIYHTQWNLSTTILTRKLRLGLHLLLMPQKESPSRLHTKSQHQGTPIENPSLCVSCHNNPIACSQPNTLNIITSSSPLMEKQQPHRYNKTNVSRNTYLATNLGHYFL